MKTKLNVEITKEDGTKVVEEREYDLIDEKEEIEKKKTLREEFRTEYEKEFIEELKEDKKTASKQKEEDNKPLRRIRNFFTGNKE